MNNKMQIGRGGCLPSDTLTSMTGRIITASITLLRRISNLESKLSCFFTKSICFKLLMFLILATTAYSATYYVNGASGNDGNPGTIGSPWQTIHKANITLVAGDTVYIRGGTTDYQVYNIGTLNTVQEGINPHNSGTDASHRITYAVYPGEKVIFDGSISYTTTATAIEIADKNWIKVTGYDGSTNAMNLKCINFSDGFLLIQSNHHLNDGNWDGTGGSNYNEISYCEFAYDTYRKYYNREWQQNHSYSVGAAIPHFYITILNCPLKKELLQCWTTRANSQWEKSQEMRKGIGGKG
jgi:hypothetical protein